MRTKLTVVLLTLVTIVCAQEKYSVVLERAQGLTPYEAIYLLMDYQQDFPQQANVYYQLGNRCYELLSSRNALYNYHEYSELLYNTRLFYGNCLHFAKDQKLPGWQYAELAGGEKRIEYAVLESYLKPRLKEVERRKIACDSIHNSFYRLVEQYNRCQQLFSRFLTRYTREKTAHLQLTAEQRKELELLADEAAQLDTRIKAYTNALALEPLEGYNPQFRWLPIELYRLDGLTATDFLQNDVPLWDYNRWVSHFLDEQKEQYEQLYADLYKEHARLSSQVARYRAGNPMSDRLDESLMGRCARLELTTPQVQAVGSMQALVRIGATEQQLAKMKAPEGLRELVPQLQLLRSAEAARPRVKEEPYITPADSAIYKMQMQIIQWAQPLALLQQPTHTSPVNGEVTRYTPADGEQVHVLLSTTNGWRTVVTDEAKQELRVLQLDYTLTVTKTLLRLVGEQPLVLTNLPDSRWALITDQHIYWGD